VLESGERFLAEIGAFALREPGAFH
jgi:hypothetical protein